MTSSHFFCPPAMYSLADRGGGGGSLVEGNRVKGVVMPEM